MSGKLRGKNNGRRWYSCGKIAFANSADFQNAD